MNRRTIDTLLAVMAVLILGGCIALLFTVPAETPAPAPASPNAPASGDLVERPKTWDGQTIPFRGEAIGEAMVRGDHAWLHLNDDAYYLKNVEEGAGLAGFNTGMPVFLPAQLARKVTTFGDYKHEGDIAEVTGVFNTACAEHGGDTDIHAATLEIVTPGRPAVDRIRPWKVALAVALVLLALILWRLERRSTLSLARGAVTRSRA